ncbi:MAG: hypothetical protein ACE5FH_06950, partial [Candidatus Zixiibacteriota bacterium]
MQQLFASLLIASLLSSAPLARSGIPDDQFWEGLLIFDSSLSGNVWALTVYNSELIAGGDFITAGGDTVNHIARWDGSNWHPLGLGMNGFVHALAVYQGELIAGGSFTQANRFEVNYIAAWDGINWRSIQSGMNQAVLSFGLYDNKLIVGGMFTTAGVV